MAFQITNRTNDVVAYVVKNIVMNKQLSEVIGVVLGGFVYNKESELTGHVANNKIIDPRGFIIGNLEVAEQPAHITNKLLMEAWDLIQGISNHSCTWVEQKQQWAIGA